MLSHLGLQFNVEVCKATGKFCARVGCAIDKILSFLIEGVGLSGVGRHVTWFGGAGHPLPGVCIMKCAKINSSSFTNNDFKGYKIHT